MKITPLVLVCDERETGAKMSMDCFIIINVEGTSIIIV